MLFHLSPADGVKALQNMACCARYLLSSTFPAGSNTVVELKAGDNGAVFYRINLNQPPFGLPKPRLTFQEVEEGKTLGLWDLHDPKVRAALFLVQP